MKKTLIRISVTLASLVTLAVSPTISESLQASNQGANYRINNDTSVSVSAAESASVSKNVIADAVVAKTDDRAEKLAAFFVSQSSPFVNVATDFIKTADKYDIDWTLLPAITGVESSYGVHVPARSYNPFGWNNGNYHFASWAAAIDTVAQGLRTRYAPTGEITPFRIGHMYAANPTWAARVAKNQAIILTSAE